MKQKLFENTGGNQFRLAVEEENVKMSTEELQAMWQDDENGEYIQINPDDSVVYVAHGKAMNQIAPKGIGDNMFRIINSWMKSKNFYPNIWQVNDHGNIELLNYQGKSLGGLV